MIDVYFYLWTSLANNFSPFFHLFFLLYAAESPCKSSCRVLPQVFSSPLSLKSKAGKSSCTSVPQSIHLCARQIWKETFSDSVQKKEEKQCWEPPMWIRDIMNHLFCRISKQGKFLKTSLPPRFGIYIFADNVIAKTEWLRLKMRSEGKSEYNVLHKTLFAAHWRRSPS